MDTKTCYTFDWTTGVYLFSEEVKRQGNGEFQLTGFNCTFVELPEYGKYEIPVFNKETETWKIEPDYRNIPYYKISDYWWAEDLYMHTYGNIPEGMSLIKADKPQIAIDAGALVETIANKKKYLADTDYIHSVILEEPEKSEKYISIIEERKKIRASIDPLQTELDELKSQITLQYGEEALNHL